LAHAVIATLCPAGEEPADGDRCAEIRICAERRLGELMEGQKATVAVARAQPIGARIEARRGIQNNPRRAQRFAREEGTYAIARPDDGAGKTSCNRGNDGLTAMGRRLDT
jgi:hypothetical protein